MPKLIMPAVVLLLVANVALAQSWSGDAGSLVTKFKPPDRRVRDVAFSPNGRLLAASYGHSDEGGVTIWNVSDQRVVANLLFKTKDAVGVPRITFSHDGDFFWAATENGDVIRWNVGAWRSKKTILANRGRPTDLTSSRNLLGFTSEDVVLVYNLNTAEVIELARKAKADPGDSFHGISFTPDEKLVAVSGRRGTRLWDIETRKQLTEWEAKSFGFFGGLSPAGNYLIAGGGPVFGKKSVQIWNMKERKLFNEFAKFRGGLFSMAISHSEKLLALAGGTYGDTGGDLSLWSIESGNEIAYTSFGRTPMHGLAFSPDDSTLAVGSEDGFVLVYNVERLNGPMVKKQTSLLCGEIVLDGLRGYIRSLTKVAMPMSGFDYPWKLEVVNSETVQELNGAPVVLEDWSIESSAGADQARIHEIRSLLDDRARAFSDHVVFGYVQNPGWDQGYVAKLYNDGRFVAANNNGKCLAYGSLADLKTDFSTVRNRLISSGLTSISVEPLTLGADHYSTAFIELTLNGVPELRSDADDIAVLLKGGPAKKREAFSRIFATEKQFVSSILHAGMKLPRPTAK